MKMTKQRETLIRDMTREQLVEAVTRINPSPRFVEEAEDKSDLEIRRGLVRHFAGEMTDAQADEVLAAERVEAVEEPPRYRVDVSLTIDTWDPAPTATEVADAVRQYLEGPLNCPTGLADGTIVTKEFTPDAVEAKARRID